MSCAHRLVRIRMTSIVLVTETHIWTPTGLCNWMRFSGGIITHIGTGECSWHFKGVLQSTRAQNI
jgi:hypothetical protein